MSTIVLACPICLQKIRAPVSVVGKQIRCPQCKNGFTAIDPNAVANEPALSLPRPAVNGPTDADPLGLEADAGVAAAYGGGGSAFVDFMALRRVITPTILTPLFWFGVALMLLGGLVTTIVAIAGMAAKTTPALPGLLTVLIAFVATVGGILLWRVLCEALATIFRTADQVRELMERGR